MRFGPLAAVLGRISSNHYKVVRPNDPTQHSCRSQHPDLSRPRAPLSWTRTSTLEGLVLSGTAGKRRSTAYHAGPRRASGSKGWWVLFHQIHHSPSRIEALT